MWYLQENREGDQEDGYCQVSSSAHNSPQQVSHHLTHLSDWLFILIRTRFYQDGMYTRKKQNFVNFDLKNMNIGQYAVQGFDNRHNR